MLVVVGALAAPRPAPAQPEPFNAFLSPSFQRVEIGETAIVRFEVDSTATGFNGYEVDIRFDPDIVQPVTVEEGDLMTGACGNNWFLFSFTDTTVFISHVTLCAGVSDKRLCRLR